MKRSDGKEIIADTDNEKMLIRNYEDYKDNDLSYSQNIHSAESSNDWKAYQLIGFFMYEQFKLHKLNVSASLLIKDYRCKQLKITTLLKIKS